MPIQHVQYTELSADHVQLASFDGKALELEIRHWLSDGWSLTGHSTELGHPQTAELIRYDTVEGRRRSKWWDLEP